ncbi:MAG: aspartate/glutamate racemase family protein [Clostridia bacterium]|nr:aspartate/glutamate racemase family protein [Clostridia bacterium]
MKIGICDSGVGGIAVMKEIVKKFPSNTYVYISDCKHVPYGNKPESLIKSYCKKALEHALKQGVELLIVACNTMSVIGREIFIKNKKIPVLFVRPNVKKMFKEKRNNVKFFCTQKTSKSRAIGRLANKCSHIVVGCENLASDIEKNIFHLDRVDCAIFKEDKNLTKIYLGCTHYIFIKDKIKQLFPQAEIYDGVDEVIYQLQKILPKQTSDSKILQVKFVGSGKYRMKKVFFKYF